MITLKHTQRSIKIDTAQLERDIAAFLKELGYADFDIGVWVTTDATIKKYNHMYREKNKATDILSFPYHPDLKAGERIIVHEEEDKNLGDILISAPYVARAAQKLGVTFEHRLRRLLAHGICHLLGYDHHGDAEYKKMITQEYALLKKLFGKAQADIMLASEIES